MFSKTKSKQLWLIFVIGMKNYFSSWLNLLQGVALPLVILLVWLTFKSDDPFILIALVGGSILRNSLYSFHRTLISERSNRWVTKLDGMPLHLTIRIFAQVLVSLTITIVVSAMLFTLGFLGFSEQQQYIPHINWYMVISGLFLLVILSNLCAYVLNEWSTSSEWSQVVAVIFFNLCWNLLGCAYPYYIIAEYDVLNIITYVFPHRYMFNVIQAGWVGAVNMNYISDINPQYSTDFGMGGKLWIPYIATFLFLALFLVSIFGHRHIKGMTIFRTKEGAVYSKKIESEYIHKVRNSNSIEELKKIFDDHKRKTKKTLTIETAEITNEINEATQRIENDK